MSYVIQCHCGQQMTVEDEHAGRQAICVNCRATIRIPEKPAALGAVAMVESESGKTQPSPGMVPPSKPSATLSGYYGGGGGTVPYNQGSGQTWFKPHRGGTVLAFGIASILLGCCCAGIWAGIPAIVMGINDLSDIRAGKMDPSGKSQTTAGLICGALGLLLTIGQPLLSFGLGGFNQLPWNPEYFRN